MSKVIFNYEGVDTIVLCEENEKMKEIFKRYGNKRELDINNLYFLYNGNKINIELKLNEIINNYDKERKEVSILVINKNNTVVLNKEKKLEFPICPKCNENIILEIKDYKINLYDCKYKHNIRNILFKEYENTQNIDISKIICDKCKLANKSNIYNNELYICLDCNINLCPLCKLKHEKEHKIINYDLKNYLCYKHNENYIRYCNECKLNICIRCEKEHINHKTISFGEIINDDNKINELKENINKLKDEINGIINKVKNIIDNIEIYYNISKNINNKNRNYETLKNINEFINYNNIIIKDINEIINDNNINNKFNNLMNIYEKLNIYNLF